MAASCSKCGKQIGGLDNYGSSSAPLCYDCANKRSCSNCQKSISMNDQADYNGHLVCKACKDIMEKKDAAVLASKAKASSELSFDNLSSKMSIVNFALSILFFVIFILNIVTIDWSSSSALIVTTNAIYISFALLISAVFFCTGTIIHAMNKLFIKNKIPKRVG